MATSVLMSATDHQTTNPRLTLPQQDHDHQSTRRSSGRRKSKGGDSSQQKKKNPQRGMGVEKLERLLLKDRWEKMTAGLTTTTTTNQGFAAINPSASISDPALMISASVPVQICKLGGYGVPNQNPNHLGFHGQMGVGLGSDHFVGKNVSTLIGSKELSSTPNVLSCYSDHCNACHKKKKVNCSENVGSGRVRSDMYMQMCNVGDYGFLGLNIRDNHSITNQEIHGAKVPQLGYALGNCKQGVEVVAVHRRGWESGVLMEYEFFPSGRRSNDGDDDDDDDDKNDGDGLVMMKMVGGGGASTGTSSSSSSSMVDNCIDLSLKLSSY